MNPTEEIRALEDLIDAVVQALQQSIQDGEIIDDSILSALAEEINFATQRIQELEQQEPSEVLQPTPVPQGADLLWILSGGDPDAFVNYLRTIPDPSLNALISNPTQLDQLIDHLSRTMPQGERGSEDGIPQADLNSSNIYGFQYNPKNGRLLVRFQSGSVYGYDGVPAPIFNIFQKGAVPAKTNGQNQYGKWWKGKIPSLGAAFYNMIRERGYPYERLA